MEELPPKSLWISFALAGICVALIGWITFDKSNQERYVIYSVLIGFCIAAFPWIKTFRIKGLFEVEKAIADVKKTTRDQLDQTGRHFDDRLEVLRAHMMSYVHTVQDQISQQVSHQNTDLKTSLSSIQNQVSHLSLDQRITQRQNVSVTINERKYSQEEERQVREDKEQFEILIKNTKWRLWDPTSWLKAFRKPFIEVACNRRSLNINEVQFNQVYSVSGDISQDPLLSIMHASFDGVLLTQLKDFFFSVMFRDRPNSHMFDLLIRLLSVLQKYREAKGRLCGLVFIIVVEPRVSITKERAVEIENYLREDLSSFMSSGLLEFEPVEMQSVKSIYGKGPREKGNAESGQSK